MNFKAQSIKQLLLVIGVVLALLLLTLNRGLAQEANKEPVYKCPPCGCSADDKLVHGPGNCTTCNMPLINTLNPNEGLNYQNITAGQLCLVFQANPDILLLDVRSKAEFDGKASELRRFKNAINIPIGEIEKRISELDEYKEKEILVHCSISARSPRVSKILADHGFTKIRNLMGGLSFWNEADQSALPCKEEFLNQPQR